MKMISRVSLAAMLGTITALFAFEQGCATDKMDLGQGGNDLLKGDIDAGTGLCGAAACANGQLCCAGPDEFCSPTCMNVDRCPVYGRLCKMPDGGGGGSSGDGGTAGPLHWYTTCGYPICGPGNDGGGVGSLPDGGQCASEGSLCTEKGQTCGTPSGQNCGVTLVCDDHDPKAGGCPISSRTFKNGIHYLDAREVDQLHDETVRTKLATYKYKGEYADPAPTHLGFIIEDQPQSLSVDSTHNRVDLYGYTSMVVATIQVQEREIAELRKELAEVRSACTQHAARR